MNEPSELVREEQPTFGKLTNAAKIDLHNSMAIPDKAGAFADIS